MKCFYINESMLQNNEFSKIMLQRFLTYYHRHQGDLLLISAVTAISLQDIPEDIHYVVSPSAFEIQQLKGEVMPHYALLDDRKLQSLCSGMCIVFDTESKSEERIYFDIIHDPMADLTNRIMDEVQSLLDEMQIKKHFYN